MMWVISKFLAPRITGTQARRKSKPPCHFVLHDNNIGACVPVQVFHVRFPDILNPAYMGVRN